MSRAIFLFILIQLSLTGLWCQEKTVQAEAETSTVEAAEKKDVEESADPEKTPDKPESEEESKYAYLWDNSTVMFKNTWKDMAYFTGKVIFYAIVEGIVLFMIGVVIGYLLYRMCRKRSLFEFPFKWNRYLKWVWGPAFVLSLSIGLGAAGLYLGAGGAVKKSIRNDNIVQRVVANIYCVIALDSMDYQLKGEESVEEIKEVANQSRDLARAVHTDLGTFIKICCLEWHKEGKISKRHLSLINRISDSTVGKLVLDQLYEKFDPRIAIPVMFAISRGGPESQKYLKENPKAHPVAAAFTEIIRRVNNELCRLINSVVYPTAFLAAFLGFIVPFTILVFVIIINRLFFRKTLVAEQIESHALPGENKAKN